jgi:hypothetical protein
MTQMAALGPADVTGSHFVQFYDAEPDALVRNVADFIDDGLRNGDSVLVIATPEHSDAFLGALGERRGHDLRTRQLVFLDAEGTLELFMADGRPDWRRFEHVIGGTIRGLRRAKPAATLRAYGEMVGLLWAAGNVDAAVQLEKFWNVLLGGDEFTLFCGYPLDVFADDFHAGSVHELLCAHSHVLPGTTSSMEAALERAMREVLGSEADVVRRGVQLSVNPAWGAVSGVEATIFWLRQHQPGYATEVLARARNYYRAGA